MRKKINIEPLWYLLPPIIVLSVFVYYAFFRTVFTSLYLTTPEGSLDKFVGLANYIEYIFTSADFLNSLYVTFKFVLLTVPASIFLAFILSTLSNAEMKGFSVFRTVYSLPLAISSASAAIIWSLLFHPTIGILNYLLSIFKIPQVEWLTDSRWAIISISIVTVWLNLAMNYIFILAGLKGVPKELYESAQIDGASSLRRHISVTIPMISPVLFFLLIIDTINAFQQFAVINILTEGGPINSTNTLVYAIYRDAFFNFRFGVACAESVILFLLILFLTLLQRKLGESKVFYNY
jgi:sn-glycerol 3-phosphate transport system permease protein